jgi:hypothetical protein
VTDPVALRIRIDLERLASRLVMLLEPAVRLFRELVDAYAFNRRMVVIEVEVAFDACAFESGVERSFLNAQRA